ncbi:LytS/YhcK type 5TM receptor domain-containing protein [Clostridium niameyense]|uniref:LytS/YhcK type 5TM receptor domain-containing protein n=1 Tax=Clostridium niameyense TaxID=1622073 RepID=UPI00067F5C46|nr:LytS/YhcK type 5TM receptor domain-containing protein [Clostridium niameyense]
MIYIQLLESMSLIGIAAYLYSQTRTFEGLIKEELNLKNKIIMILFFSTLSILGTYTGVNVEHYALANTRPIGAIVAGYIGGPIVGIIVGIIAGLHRYSLGGYTALACAISTIVEGLVGGIGSKFLKNDELSISIGFISAIVAEILQMVIIILISKPYEYALNLEKIIAFPMIIINSVGVAIFINIINNTQQRYNEIGAIQLQKALNIAKRTSIYLRNGFNKDIAYKVCNIIYEMIDTKGVFISDGKDVVSYLGKNIDEGELKGSIKDYCKYKNYAVINLVQSRKKFYCIPIYIKEKDFKFVIGLGIKLSKIDKYFIEFCKELSSLLATQIELYELDQLAQEGAKAEFKALSAQIHPHFLFNTLNTIASFCRIDPNKARKLILDLSNYFRQTLKKETDFVTLKEELDFINSYLSIEKARFGERLIISKNISEELMNIKMPLFILQPIIENSIKHGILIKPEGGEVKIMAVQQRDEIKFTVEDTGMGMTEKRLKEVLENWPGIGLFNVSKRLKLLYGEDNNLYIESHLNKGTKVSFYIPKEVIKVEKN